MCALTPVTKFLKELPTDWEFFPISDLHPFYNRWVIKAQVKLKTTTIYKSKDKRKFFSVILSDDSGEIQALIFDDQCDKYCDILEVGQVYIIHRGLIKETRNNSQHSRHPYELSFNSLTRVVPWKDKSQELFPPPFQENSSKAIIVNKDNCPTNETGPSVCVPKAEEKSAHCEEPAFICASSTSQCQLQIEKVNCTVYERVHPVAEEKESLENNSTKSVSQVKRKAVKRRASASPSLSGCVLLDSTHEESSNPGGEDSLTFKKNGPGRKIQKRTPELKEIDDDFIIEGETLRIFERPLQFAPLLQVAMLKENFIIDVIGIVKCCSDTSIINENDKKSYKMIEIFLVDQSNLGVVVELRDSEFPSVGSPVLAVKGAVVCGFGRSKRLLVTEESTLLIDPDLPEAHRLRHWSKDSEGFHQRKRDISDPIEGGFLALSWMTIKEMKAVCMKELMEDSRYFTCKVIVQSMDSPEIFFKACPESFCNKIVYETDIDKVRCASCYKEYTSFNYSLPLVVNLMDTTGSFSATVPPWELQRFLLSCSIPDPQNFEGLGNARELSRVLRTLHFKEFIIRVCATTEKSKMGNLVKFSVENVCPLNHEDYNRYLLQKINSQYLS